jgi:uncharacterized protein with NRDE domain
MCLIAFTWQSVPGFELVVAANRDEFYARPSDTLAWWPQQDILAGRDNLGGGTWMGVSRTGRFAAVTNFRDIGDRKPDALSRGQLVADFLQSTLSATDYIQHLRLRAACFQGFNLLLFDGIRLMGFESRFDAVVVFTQGTHAVSNHRFNAPWPKAERLKAVLADYPLDDDHLFTALASHQLAADSDLPDTGIGLEWERILSAAFVATPTYGTRASTLLRIGGGQVQLIERSFGPLGALGEQKEQFAFGT